MLCNLKSKHIYRYSEYVHNDYNVVRSVKVFLTLRCCVILCSDLPNWIY